MSQPLAGLRTPPRPRSRAAAQPSPGGRVSPSPARPLAGFAGTPFGSGEERNGGGASAAAASPAPPATTALVSILGAPLLHSELCAAADLRPSLGESPLCYFQWRAQMQHSARLTCGTACAPAPSLTRRTRARITTR
jgi:hypothetical protein